MMLKQLNTSLKKKFKKLDLEKYIEYIHFGLTSQDINNTATPILFKESLENIYYQELKKLLKKLNFLSKNGEMLVCLLKLTVNLHHQQKWGKK